MLKTVDDRTAAVRSLMESLGGSLDHVYWAADMRSAFALAELPDPAVAAAIAAVMTKTGACANVEGPAAGASVLPGRGQPITGG